MLAALTGEDIFFAEVHGGFLQRIIDRADIDVIPLHACAGIVHIRKLIAILKRASSDRSHGGRNGDALCILEIIEGNIADTGNAFVDDYRRDTLAQAVIARVIGAVIVHRAAAGDG